MDTLIENIEKVATNIEENFLEHFIIQVVIHSLLAGIAIDYNKDGYKKHFAKIHTALFLITLFFSYHYFDGQLKNNITNVKNDTDFFSDHPFLNHNFFSLI